MIHLKKTLLLVLGITLFLFTSCENEQIDELQGDIEQTNPEPDIYIKKFNVIINGDTFETTQTNNDLDFSNFTEEAKEAFEKGSVFWQDDTAIVFETPEKMDAHIKKVYGVDLNDNQSKNYSSSRAPYWKWSNGIRSNYIHKYWQGGKFYLRRSWSDRRLVTFKNTNNPLSLVAGHNIDALDVGGNWGWFAITTNARVLVEVYRQPNHRGTKNVYRINQWSGRQIPYYSVRSFEVHHY